MGKFDLRIFEYEIINNSSPTIVYPTNLTNMVTKITKLRMSDYKSNSQKYKSNTGFMGPLDM